MPIDYQKEIEEKIKSLLKYDKWEKNTIAEIFDYIHEHKEKFLSTFNAWFIKYFEISFDSIIEAMDQINSENKADRPMHRGTQWLIIRNNLPTLFSAFSLLTSGFYVDSITLIRSLFESVIRIIYISHSPEDKDSALLYGIQWTKKFNITSFTKDILKIDRHYRLLSAKAHSNWLKTMKDLIDISQNGQKKRINIELWRDMDELTLTLNRLEFIIWNYLFFIKEFLLYNNKEFYSKLTDIERWFYALFHSLSISHPQNTFHQKCNESITIYEDMKIKENNIKK